jgi:hypothetical protein
MLTLTLSLTALISFAVAPQPTSESTSAVAQAKAFFTKFVEMEQAYDIAIADLYADDAVIKNKRTYPTGEVRELTIPPAQFKQLLRQAMPLAKSRGDRSTYSSCGYKPAGGNVRISCSRYSELKQYTSPYSLLVGPNRAGKWQILEELSQSKP